jgi:hypothetical protein
MQRLNTLLSKYLFTHLLKCCYLFVVVSSNITTHYYITGEIMERKSKVTQSAVNAACEQLQADSKNVTVNAVISITGGSFGSVASLGDF